jgi:radical SAM-linked protein
MRDEVLGLSLDDLEAAILPRVSRPARYLPLILGLRERSPAAPRAVIVAPDLLEAAIMHPVVPALYHGLHQAGVAAELAFLPWLDFEDELRRAQLPLYALESRRPIGDFPLLVVPVLRELMATGVIELLDLGGIPLHASERSGRDPIVIGAGPALANPEPFAPFLDAILIGDPEAALSDLAPLVERYAGGRLARPAMLEALAATPGIYVPSLVPVGPDGQGWLVAAPGQTPIPGRYLAQMPPSAPPLQTLIEARGDVLELEVQRGCPRRCRFCQPARAAGPLRELTASDLVTAAANGVAQGGWEEIVLGGLMPPDWTELGPGVDALGRSFLGTGVALGLGAAAGERLPKSVLVELARVRRTVLAFAPEAGSERLRRVIGKPLDETALLAAVSEAAGLGWPSVKVHFMIGLPTETDEDLVGIADLCARIVEAGRRPGGRFAVQVAVQPFVPRAQTPFQWQAQLPLDDLRRRMKRLRGLLRRRPLRLRWGQPEAAQVSALLSRGDRRLGRVILSAYQNGARLDDWSEQLRPILWWRAAAEAGLDLAQELGARAPGAPLPWSHVVLGEGETHFALEHARAGRGEATPPKSLSIAASAADRRTGATSLAGAGLFAGSPIASLGPDGRSALFGRGRLRRRVGREAVHQHRLRFQKTDPVRFISHLDVVRLLDRALRRAGIAVAFSTGYSRHPKMSFGPPLPVGMIGWDEYLDVELNEERSTEFVDVINAELPDGIRIVESVPILSKIQSLMSLIDHADYRLSFPRHARRLLGDLSPHALRTSLDEAVRHFFSHDRAYVVHPSPVGERSVEITEGVRRLVVVTGDDTFPALELTLRLAGEGAVRPLDLAGFLLGESSLDPHLLRVERQRLYSLRGDRKVTPLEAAQGEELLGVVGAADRLSGVGRPDVQRDRHQRRSGRDSYRHSRRG